MTEMVRAGHVQVGSLSDNGARLADSDGNVYFTKVFQVPPIEGFAWRQDNWEEQIETLAKKMAEEVRVPILPSPLPDRWREQATGMEALGVHDGPTPCRWSVAYSLYYDAILLRIDVTFKAPA